ncbi:MAG TPA: c-type cytochrome biogenesis protein CcmI [Caulobacteraceae bacterium]|nr:c-type cytochrome biogenesis protein CcmI [Caulobacteraceae bacterium]
MLLFLIVAGLISSGAALLILLRAARTGRVGAPADPTLEVYRRQMAEIDELAERGLLGHDELRAARAETGRRLLGEAERRQVPAPGLSAGAARRLVLIAAVAAPLVALVAYLMTGTPGLPDMPFQARLNSWRQTNPGRLSLPEMAAVLASDVKSKPNDPQPLYYLGVVERAEGDLPSALQHLEKSADLDPSDAKVWTAIGTALVDQDQGQVGDAAADAFRRALQIDPTSLQARYFLARGDIAAGRLQQGLAGWRDLMASLPAQDPRQAELKAEIDLVASTGKLDSLQPQADQSQPAESGQESAFIRSMVEGLAARLKAQPDDPEGWARLIRAYGVLHQEDRRDAAIAEAQKLFRSRPNDLKTALQGETQAAPPPAPPG